MIQIVLLFFLSGVFSGMKEEITCINRICTKFSDKPVQIINICLDDGNEKWKISLTGCFKKRNNQFKLIRLAKKQFRCRRHLFRSLGNALCDMA